MNGFRFKHSIMEAVHGIRSVYDNEQNFRFQVAAVLGVCVLAFFFHLPRLDVMLLIMATGLVLALELVNSAIERTLDIVKPRLDDQVKMVKHIMAGAVFVGALVALCIGGAIFFPRFF